jgi:hypothetical protein
MKTLVARISRAVVAQIPGTTANIAAEKRRAEKELRAAGYSRAEAVTMVSARFRNRE